VANDALLGQGAYAAGHRATELIPGTDRGTALCKGLSGQRSEIVQVHFLPVARGNDQVSPLVGWALDEMARQGRPVPGTGAPARVVEARDLLADLDAVMTGPDRAKLPDVAARLRALAPGWGPYQPLTGTALGQMLRAEGVRVLTTDGYLWLDPAGVRSALARRAEDGELDA
jgi:S-DNA-T family DNA segregation ATPase FtsK/SpoIIIE